MQTRTAARILGVVYIVVGILGFVPGISPPAPAGSPTLAVGTAYNYVLGLFAVNVLHDIVHVAVGAWALFAGASATAARRFWRAIAVVFALLFVLGLIPATQTLFGLTPLFGYDAWLHLLTAIVALYFGWGAAAQETVAA